MMTTTGDSFDASTELSDLLDEVRPTEVRPTEVTGGMTPEELAASDMEEEGSPIVEELEEEDEDDADLEGDDEEEDEDDVDDEDFDDDEDDLDEELEDDESDWDDEDEDDEDDEDWDEDDDGDGPAAFIDEAGCDDFEDADVTVEVDIVEVQCDDAAGDCVTVVQETITERMIAAN